MDELKKNSIGRRRFVKSATLHELFLWTDFYAKIIYEIQTSSTLQRVGKKKIIEINTKTNQAHLLVEVLGPPQLPFEILDMEPRVIFVYTHPLGIFEEDFNTIKKKAQSLKDQVLENLADFYHIVFDEEHLELHFFI